MIDIDLMSLSEREVSVEDDTSVCTRKGAEHVVVGEISVALRHSREVAMGFPNGFGVAEITFKHKHNQCGGVYKAAHKRASSTKFGREIFMY